jgi:cytochrome bd ubiquinol oxidase subunit I
MSVQTLSQVQFAVTSVYHFFFVPLTLGLSVLVALMETFYYRTGKEVYREMTRFWGKLFLINFAMGVVTGIVQEFQFGMNWSEYSRYVGDIFGAPLAIEALLAFFLESTFLGLWIFGWKRLSKGLHLMVIWLVALGSNLSALWILIANSFMQFPTGYTLVDGKPVMSSFSQLISSSMVWLEFSHTVLAGFTTGAFFLIGISAYHLFRKQHEDFFKRSFRIGTFFGLGAVVLLILVGHFQGQEMVRTQPMKMAAAEAVWHTTDPASESLLTIVDQSTQTDIVSIRIPYLLSFLTYDRFSGEIKGMIELNQEYQEKYGAGNYIPPITVTYWSFRLMVGAGFLMLFLAAICLYGLLRPKEGKWKARILAALPWAIGLPYLANTTGWLLTEIGRQPWVVYGLLKTSDAVSPNLTSGMVLVSLIGFALVYGVLMTADVFLIARFAKAGPIPEAINLSDEESEMN